MIRKTGTTLTGAGLLLMLAGLCLFLWNRREAALAAERAADALVRIRDAMEAEAALLQEDDVEMTEGSGKRGGETDMPTVTIDGYEYAGYIGIPALELELPVMAQWSYPRLKIAPCRYCGSAAENNLVIAAHNYPRHFGGLSKLQKGGRGVFYGYGGDGVAIPGGSRGRACAGGSGGNDGWGIRADAVYLYLRRGEPGYRAVCEGGVSIFCSCWNRMIHIGENLEDRKIC